MFLSTLKEHLDKCRTFNLKQFPVPSVLPSHYSWNLLTKSSEKVWPMFNVFREVLVFQYFLWDGYCLKFKTTFKILHMSNPTIVPFLSCPIFADSRMQIQNWKQINIAKLPTIFAPKNHLMHFLVSYLLFPPLFILYKNIFVKNKTSQPESYM